MAWDMGAVAGVAGLVIALGNTAWTIRRDVRDRGRLRVELDIAYPRAPGIITHTNPMTTRDHCLVTITNVGGRALRPAKIIGTSRSSDGGTYTWYIVPRSFPCDLAPNGQAFEWINDTALPAVAALERLDVIDTTDRRWSVPRRQLRVVRRRVAAAVDAAIAETA
jgi:hypothetical protein